MTESLQKIVESYRADGGNVITMRLPLDFDGGEEE